jgi:hypothetical protein
MYCKVGNAIRRPRSFASWCRSAYEKKIPAIIDAARTMAANPDIIAGSLRTIRAARHTGCVTVCTWGFLCSFYVGTPCTTCHNRSVNNFSLSAMARSRFVRVRRLLCGSCFEKRAPLANEKMLGTASSARVSEWRANVPLYHDFHKATIIKTTSPAAAISNVQAGTCQLSTLRLAMILPFSSTTLTNVRFSPSRRTKQDGALSQVAAHNAGPRRRWEVRSTPVLDLTTVNDVEMVDGHDGPRYGARLT